MTEPAAGSDLQGVKTRAVRDGDDYIVNGSKIFITNGYLAELIALVVKTTPGEGAKGTSILMVETKDLPGYRVGRILDKMGLKAQDTAELFFENVRVPAANLLGGAEGQGFYQLMSDLPYERALIAVVGVGAMEGAVGGDGTLRQGAQGLRQEHRRVPEHQIQTRGDRHQDAGGARVRRRLHRENRRRHARHRHRLDGQVLGHRYPAGSARRMRAAARRLRLHERVPGVPHVRGFARTAHLRRHQRNHEGIDFALDLGRPRCGGAMRAL